MSRKRILYGALTGVVVLGGLYLVAAIRYRSRCAAPRATCLEHRNAGCSMDGDYRLAIGGREIEATCDMKTDGGGWTLVGNYLHRAKAPGGAVALLDRLPLEGSSHLGEDEQNTVHWGHASTVLLAALPFREVRFACRTSAHSRRLDFVVFSDSCLNYFRTGKGACLGTPDLLSEFRQRVRALPGHTARLPLTADKGHRDMADNALVDYPFFVDWRENWSIGDRWQCDDTQADDANNTLHRIWVR